jgi:hypothetical protein
MQDRIIPLRAEVWSHKTVTHRASLLIEVPMSNQEIRVITNYRTPKVSHHVFVLGVSILYFLQF